MWVRQGRTDAWIAHQLEVSVSDIRGFKREHELAPEGSDGDADTITPGAEPEEPDLRAEDDALVAAELEAELEADDGEDIEVEGEGGAGDEGAADDADGDAGDDSDEKPKRRRRGRRGGRGRGRAGAGRGTPLEGTFDHGEEGYGLWLDPAVQDDPVYAEHWAGHRPVTIQVEAERIVITRAGEDAGDSEDSD